MGFIVHPSEWEVEHAGAVFAGQAYQATHDGALPDTPMWRMLEFRHSLNPARFDHWHPNVGLILENGDSGTFTEGVAGASPAPHHWIGYMRGPSPSTAIGLPRVWGVGITLPPTSHFSPPGFTPVPPISEAATSTGSQPPPPPPASPSVVPEPFAVLQGLTAVALAGAYLARRVRRIGVA